MKKLCLLFFMLATVCRLSAQMLSKEEVLTFLQENFPKMDSLMQQKNYAGAENLSLEIIERINRAKPEYQRDFIGLRSHIYYNLACAYSLQKKPQEAVQTLAKAIDDGYYNYIGTLRDPDFEPIRELPEFIKQLERLEKYDFLVILKSAKTYDEPEERPEFFYQPAQTTELAALRQELNLDSIAGNGDEISRIKKMMEWVQNTVRHDGSNRPDVPVNALSLIAYSKQTGRGVNCRMLATILNECYLAMGIPSRFVTCLPKSDTDTECHVINSVWSETLDKWIWMDPSFDAWVTDEQGNLLSIREVRDRAVNDLPLAINPQANWNNEKPYSKEDYLDAYMYKNLYWLECPVRAVVGTEIDREGEPSRCYVRLCPPGFWGNSIRKNMHITHDPDFFWQKPPTTFQPQSIVE